jgi:hypothetical protein
VLVCTIEAVAIRGHTPLPTEGHHRMPTTTNTKTQGDAQRAAHAALASVADAVAYSGIGRSRLYELARAGRVRMVKSGTRTLCDMSTVKALIASLPEASIRPSSR